MALVEADVEDGVHHAGHADAGAGAAGDEQRVLGVAELGAHGLLGLAQGVLDLGLQLGRVLVVVVVVVGADLGGEGEAGRHGQADVGHLGEVGALAAEEVLHVGPAFRLAAAEEVDVLAHDAVFLC